MPSAGPMPLPSQNSNRTGTSVPTRARRNGARHGGGAVRAAAGRRRVRRRVPGATGDAGRTVARVLVSSVTMIDLLDRVRAIRPAPMLEPAAGGGGLRQEPARMGLEPGPGRDPPGADRPSTSAS